MAVVGVLVALGTGAAHLWEVAPLLGWDAAALVFASWVWLSVGRLDPVETASHATRENPSRGSSDLVVVLAALGSLAAVAEVLVAAKGSSAGTKALMGALALASVAVSWVAVQTLFTLRYALLYYIAPVGGIDFNQHEPPRYTDFAYLAFTLGMTFQVSDTNLRNTRIRAAVLRHCLISYVFGSVILATTVNVIVSLTSGSG